MRRLIVRSIIAVIAGSLITAVVLVAVTTIAPGLLGFHPELRALVPPLCGSFYAGYVLKKHGWLVGLIVGSVYAVFLSQFWIRVLNQAIAPVGILPETWWRALGIVALSLGAGLLGAFAGALVQRSRKSPGQNAPLN